MSRTGSILVVDDSDFNRDVLSRLLVRKGFLVDTAADGAGALEAAATGQYDLVLLDVRMPGMSGLEVLSRLRKSRSQAELPVIMVTGMTESADIVEALELGANDYVTKPIDFAVVLARIHTHLSHKWTVADESGRITRLAGSLTDITDVKLADALTGLQPFELFDPAMRGRR